MKRLNLLLTAMALAFAPFVAADSETASGATGGGSATGNKGHLAAGGSASAGKDVEHGPSGAGKVEASESRSTPGKSRTTSSEPRRRSDRATASSADGAVGSGSGTR